MKTKHYDLVIMGAGLVGAAFASLLASMARQQGTPKLRIALVDNHCSSHQWPQNTHDIRVSAITAASQNLFEQLDAWQQMQNDGVYPYQQMRVWDATGKGQIHFDAQTVDEENLGYIIENRVMLKAFHQNLLKYDEVDIICPFDARQISEQDAYVILSDNTQKLHTRLIIGADGANSWVRQQLDIDITSWSYHQSAVVATVKTARHHQYTCWQQFMPSGPLAFLPLDEHFCSIVWSTSHEQAQSLLQASRRDFSQQLSQTFTMLGKVQLVSERAAFPLRLRHAREYVRPRLALIGDAAHTVHPLAGQGVNLGFQDVLSLAQIIHQAHVKKRDIGDYYLLRQYERSRKGANITMLAAMDGLKRLFSNQHPLLTLARNSGLNLVDHLPLGKQFFIRYALGKHAL